MNAYNLSPDQPSSSHLIVLTNHSDFAKQILKAAQEGTDYVCVPIVPSEFMRFVRPGERQFFIIDDDIGLGNSRKASALIRKTNTRAIIFFMSGDPRSSATLKENGFNGMILTTSIQPPDGGMNLVMKLLNLYRDGVAAELLATVSASAK